MPRIYKGTYPMYYGASKLIRERAVSMNKEAIN
jgi:hypothetical protein